MDEIVYYVIQLIRRNGWLWDSIILNEMDDCVRQFIGLNGWLCTTIEWIEWMSVKYNLLHVLVDCVIQLIGWDSR